MNAAYITTPLIFLIDSVLSLYILAVMLRFLLQSVKADFHNPLCQALVTLTHPPLKQLRRFVPPLGKIDSSSIILALLLQMLVNLSIWVLQGVQPSFFTLLILSIANLIALTLNIFIFAIFTQALLSWFNPNSYNPAFALLASLTNPILNFCRKLIPDLNGLDFSPLAVIIFLQVTKMLLLPPLEQQLAHLF